MQDTQVGFGVIGCGLQGEWHLKTYQAHAAAKLTCICDVNEELVRQQAEKYNAESWTTNYEDLLARDDLEAVSIATPDYLHHDIAVAAAQSGKNILLEKPMATSLVEAEEIAKAVTEAGVICMVDFQNRWNIAMVRAKEALEAGELGTAQMMSIRLSNKIWVPTELLSWGGQTTIGWWLGSHAVDLVTWLFDDDVVRVYSVSRSEVLSQRGLDTPDFFHSILELSRGGVAHVENCWILGNALPGVTDFRMELVGSEGTAYANCTLSGMSQIYTKDKARWPDTAVYLDIHGLPRGLGPNAIWHFADAMAAGTEPMISLQDGVKNTAIVEAIHKSAASGAPVELQ